MRAGEGARWNPLQDVRKALPAAPDVPAANAPGTSLRLLYAGWASTAAVKPRTSAETRYTMELFIGHLGHDDGLRLTRGDFADWRAAMKAGGKTNTTWNNRLSHTAAPGVGRHRRAAGEQRGGREAPPEEAANGDPPALQRR